MNYYRAAWYEREGVALTGFILGLAMIVSGIVYLGSLWDERQCRVYGEETERVTRYERLRGGCYVKLDRGWRQRAEINTRGG